MLEVWACGVGSLDEQAIAAAPAETASARTATRPGGRPPALGRGDPDARSLAVVLAMSETVLGRQLGRLIEGVDDEHLSK
jgi:hypothetical protein